MDVELACMSGSDIGELVKAGKFESALKLAHTQPRFGAGSENKSARSELDKFRPEIIEGIRGMLEEGKITGVLDIIAAYPSYFSSLELQRFKPAALGELAPLIEKKEVKEILRFTGIFNVTPADTEKFKPDIINIIMDLLKAGRIPDAMALSDAFYVSFWEIESKAPGSLKSGMDWKKLADGLSGLFKEKPA